MSHWKYYQCSKFWLWKWNNTIIQLQKIPLYIAYYIWIFFLSDACHFFRPISEVCLFLSKPNVSANQKWVNPFVKLKIDWQDNRLKLFHLILLFWFRLYKLVHILKHTAINLLRYKYCASVYSCHLQYLCYVIQIQILGLFWFGYIQRSAVARS